eukprot:g26728.t1
MPPRGRRRPGGMGNYWMRNFQRTTWENEFEDHFIVIPQIESQRGVDNVQAIARHEIVTAVGLGPYDLSADLGCCWNPEDAGYQQALSTVKAAADAAGKKVWAGCDGPALRAQGYTFLWIGTPSLLLGNGIARAIDDIHQAEQGLPASVRPMRQRLLNAALCMGCLLAFCQSKPTASAAEPIATIKREVYIPNTVPKKAPWIFVYPGKGGYREEIQTVWSHATQVKGYGDSPGEPRRRISHDNGKTWSPLVKLPPMMTFMDKVSVLDWKFCGTYDPASKRHVALSVHHVRDMRQGPPRRIFNHALIRTSADNGRTFGPPQVLKYEKGPDLDPKNVLNPKYLKTNSAYPGQSILRHSNGSLIVPVTNARIPADAHDEASPRAHWPTKGTIGSLCFVGRWNRQRTQYEWKAGKPVWLPRSIAFNGLLEADVAELTDGRVLIVWRITKTKTGNAHKWFSVSRDGGLTFSKPKILGYSDGSTMYSGSNFHRLFRSSKTGKLYWIGNVTPTNPTNAGHPRYPLVIVEVDEQALALKKSTQTVIDTRRDGEGVRMQLSNFWLIEHQETHDLEIYLTRLYENPKETFTASAYKYTLRFRTPGK